MIESTTRIYKINDEEVSFNGTANTKEFGEVKLEISALLEGKVEIDNYNNIADDYDLNIEVNIIGIIDGNRTFLNDIFDIASLAEEIKGNIEIIDDELIFDLDDENLDIYLLENDENFA